MSEASTILPRPGRGESHLPADEVGLLAVGFDLNLKCTRLITIEEVIESLG